MNQRIAKACLFASILVVPFTGRLRAAEQEEERWAFSAYAYTYFDAGGDDYVQPTVALDHGWLHLEARYNYEDRDTGSLWLGYNLSGGDEWAWEVTPMIGGVFGDMDGIGPGYKGNVSWKRLELYSEGEYIFDANESSDSFFYNWSELTFRIADWGRFGLVTQRTRAYDTDRDIQRGLLAGVSIRRVDLTTYVLNPDDNDPTWVVSVGFNF